MIARGPVHLGADRYALSFRPYIDRFSPGWCVGSWFWSDAERREVRITEIVSTDDWAVTVRAS